MSDRVTPGLRTPGMTQPSSEPVDPSRLDNMECVANGTIREEILNEAEIISVCQRPSDPCVVEIEYKLSGTGVWDLDYEWSGFSIDSTNGINGNWYKLEPKYNDPRHTTGAYNQYGWYDRVELVETGGEYKGRFVVDMCDHFSTFMSTQKIYFRLTFRKASGFFGPGDQVPPGIRNPSN